MSPARKKRQRLDTILVERGFFSSRSQAAAAVLAGEVKINAERVTKAGSLLPDDVEIEILEEQRFVSRGGLKLEKAFSQFGLDVTGRVAIDAGASTGGFTDCLLQHGASRVIAVDVGYGQLAWKLRNDPRVTVMERTNIRALEPDMLPETPQFATFDLSFISLEKVIPVVAKALAPGFEAVALIKPQFEAGRGQVGKGGVVRDEAVRREVLSRIWDFIESSGWQVRGLAESPVRGPKGNVEYLIYFAADGSAPADKAAPRKEETLDRIIALSS